MKKTWIQSIALGMAVLLLVSGCAENVSPETEKEMPSASAAETGTVPAEAGESTAPEPAETPAETEAPINEMEPDERGIYHIYTAEGLKNMALHPDGSFELAADIDLAGTEWTPVGTKTNPFSGKLNGKKHTVSDFRIAQAGEEGLLGFFGVLTGEVSDLYLEEMTVAADAASHAAGSLAAVNSGTIKRCTSAGTMEAKDVPDGFVCGEMFGIFESGKASQCAAAVDLTVAASAEDLRIGGLCGTAIAGKLSDCEANGRLDASVPASAKFGLFVGERGECVFSYCSFGGARNRKNGEYCEILSDGEDNTAFEEYKLRDNHDSVDYIAEKEMLLREEVLEHMLRQGTYRWIADREIHYVNHDDSVINTDQVYFEGQETVGLPYCHSWGSFERFLYCLDENGRIRADIPTNMIDNYFGNDCSGAVYWAWARVSSTISFTLTINMIPNGSWMSYGTVPVGSYECQGLYNSLDVVSINGNDVICEAYSALRPGDAVVYHNGQSGHTHMIVENVVIRDQNGKVNPHASYCISHGQGEDNAQISRTTWKLYRKMSYNEMLMKGFIPVSCAELVSGDKAEPWVKLSEDGQSVSSNYTVISAVLCQEKDGKTAESEVFFTGLITGEDEPERKTYKSVALSSFRSFLQEHPMEDCSSCVMKVLISTGETISVTIKP